MNDSVVTCQRLIGRTAIVTASTDGIGLGIAQRLAEEGANVVISSRKQKNVDAAVHNLKAKGLKVIGTTCHVAKGEDRQKLFKLAESTFGGIDILISNAATNPTMGPVLDCEESAWDKIFETNVKASYLLAKEVLPYLNKRNGGKIIFVSSIGGYHPSELLGAYSVSKTALLGLTKAAAIQLAKDNIQVNCLAPGIVQTKFSDALTSSEVARTEALLRIPLNRFGTPSDMGATVAFLASDDASYITGETIIVAGGMASKL
ncbi:dehydrogenase/reductase (sdr family) member 4 [Holotrichia oblita]|uniref:Dehydrogenase/reductase (Sdr family) member 4 n=1 Tax=Holotrichia oblita TaxID=644536 RepID=A0ACB9TUT7_HOLOL|nr:dehydrogenase/reductase (sdr family) member 4 [Holotrichia oblita]